MFSKTTEAKEVLKIFNTFSLRHGIRQRIKKIDLRLMDPSIHLQYNNSETVQPTLNKMTFYEELYIDAKVETVEKGKRIKIQIHPKQDVVINELTIQLPYSFQSHDEIFCNGFQSNTESLVHLPTESIPALGSLTGNNWHLLGNYRHPHLKDLSSNLHSWTYSHIRRDDGSYFLIGSLSENTGFTIIKHCCNLNVIKITWEAQDFGLAHSFPAMDIILLEGIEDKVFERYFKSMQNSITFNPPLLRSCIALSTDIETIFLQNQINTFAYQGIPLDLVLVKNDFPIAIGDWSENPPQGIPAAANTIHNAGLKAGIHFAPFLCSSQSDFFKNKKQCLLKDNGGQLVKIKNKTAPDGYFYVLDYYNKTVTDYLQSLFSALIQKWSYDYISLDWLHAVCLFPPANKTMGQMMCEALDFLRGLCGNTPIMASSVPIGAAFGRVPYCQLAPYPVESWKSTWLSWNKVRERQTALASIPTHLNRRQLNNGIFRQTPSLMIPGKQLFRYSINQQQSLLMINSLCGAGFVISKDGDTEQSEEQVSEFRQAIIDQGAKITRVANHGSKIYEIHYSNNNGRWIAYLNLNRSKTAFSHQGKRLELQSCESITLSLR